MKPTAMLITYAILGTVYDVSWYLAPVLICGIASLAVGWAEGKGVTS